MKIEESNFIRCVQELSACLRPDDEDYNPIVKLGDLYCRKTRTIFENPTIATLIEVEAVIEITNNDRSNYRTYCTNDVIKIDPHDRVNVSDIYTCLINNKKYKFKIAALFNDEWLNFFDHNVGKRFILSSEGIRYRGSIFCKFKNPQLAV